MLVKVIRLHCIGLHVLNIEKIVPAQMVRLVAVLVEQNDAEAEAIDWAFEDAEFLLPQTFQEKHGLSNMRRRKINR
jgi:hypothetical protein